MFARDDIYGFGPGTDRLGAGGFIDFGGMGRLLGTVFVIAEALFQLFLGIGVCEGVSPGGFREWRIGSVPRFPAS